MQLNDFLSSLISAYREGKLKDWLSSYIFGNFDVKGMDEIIERKVQLEEELKIVKNNLIDYNAMNEQEKKEMFEEDRIKGNETLNKYMEIKVALLKDMSDIRDLISKGKEEVKEESLSQFFNDILIALDEAEKNNNDIDIIQNRLSELNSQTFEELDGNMIAVLEASIQGRELNLTKMDELIERLTITFEELNSYL